MDSTVPALLLDALKFYRGNFISSAYSTMGFTIVAAGWLITSKSAQDFMRSHRGLGLASIVMVVLGYAGYWRMALAVQDSSHAIASELSRYYDRIVFGHYELSLAGVYGFVLIQGLATLFVVLLVASIIKEPTKAEPAEEAPSTERRRKPGQTKR